MHDEPVKVGLCFGIGDPTFEVTVPKLRRQQELSCCFKACLGVPYQRLASPQAWNCRQNICAQYEVVPTLAPGLLIEGEYPDIPNVLLNISPDRRSLAINSLDAIDLDL